MAQDNVMNLYISPDFDPAKVPRKKREKRIEVTMVLPFSCQCQTCGEFMMRGSKFNARLEALRDETYHGVKIWRFVGKCKGCNSWYSFKTDPKRLGWAAEHNITRNYEPGREAVEEEKSALQQREEEEKVDAMKALENRTLDSRRQMEIGDALEELKAMRSRQAGMGPDDILRMLNAATDGGGGGDAGGDDLTAEDEALVSTIFGGLTTPAVASGGASSVAAPAASGGMVAGGEEEEESGGGGSTKPLAPRLAVRRPMTAGGAGPSGSGGGDGRGLINGVKLTVTLKPAPSTAAATTASAADTRGSGDDSSGVAVGDKRPRPTDDGHGTNVGSGGQAAKVAKMDTTPALPVRGLVAYGSDDEDEGAT